MTDKLKGYGWLALFYGCVCLALGWLLGPIEPFWGVIGMLGSIGVYMWAEDQLRGIE